MHVAGEAGIGKSRLIAALDERLPGECYAKLRYFCAPHQRDSELHPIIGHFERAIDPGRKHTGADKLRELRALMAPTRPPPEDVALLAEMLSLPGDGLPRSTSARSAGRRGRSRRSFGNLRGLRAQRPVLIVLEDAHWSDPTTLELLDLTVDAIRDLSVFFVLTFRPEFQPRRLDRPGVSLITLDRLDRPHTAALVAQLEGRDLLPKGVVDRIVSGSDGVPLFIEELTRAFPE